MDRATRRISRPARLPGKHVAGHASHLRLGGAQLRVSSSRTIAVAYFLDWIAGDPEWLPHPVRLMGQCIQLGETRLRWPQQTPLQEAMAGAALTAAVIGGSYLATAKAIAWAQRTGCGTVAEILL